MQKSFSQIIRYQKALAALANADADYDDKYEDDEEYVKGF